MTHVLTNYNGVVIENKIYSGRIKTQSDAHIAIGAPWFAYHSVLSTIDDDARQKVSKGFGEKKRKLTTKTFSSKFFN